MRETLTKNMGQIGHNDVAELGGVDVGGAFSNARDRSPLGLCVPAMDI